MPKDIQAGRRVVTQLGRQAAWQTDSSGRQTARQVDGKLGT